MSSRQPIWRTPAIATVAIVSILAVATWYRMEGSRATALHSPVAASDAVSGGEVTGELPALPVPAARLAPSDTGARHDDAPLSQEQAEAKIINALQELEDKFQSEPVSVGWKNSTQRMIDTALSQEALSVNQSPAPIAHEAECRSFTCRIELTYSNDIEAQMGEIFLLGGIAQRLPSVQIGRLSGPDGSMKIVMYANTGVARRSSPGRH